MLREIGISPRSGCASQAESQLHQTLRLSSTRSPGAGLRAWGTTSSRLISRPLAALHPGLALHRLPLIDTLELSRRVSAEPVSPLGEGPKLCTTTRNDPVRDAELAYALFLDQSEALRLRVTDHPDEALCLHFLLATEDGKGVANLFCLPRHSGLR